jgi:hypothetical protein
MLKLKSYLAIAHQRLAQTDEARRCLKEAAAWIDEANRQEFDDLTGASPVWGGWYERIDASMLLHEAEHLIDRGAASTASLR